MAQPLEDLGRDPAADVHPAPGEHGEREIARLRPVQPDEHGERGHCQPVALGERGLADRRRRIARRQRLGERRARLPAAVGAQELEHVHQAGPRHCPLPRDMAEALAQVGEQRLLLGVARREVRVPAFRGQRPVVLARPHQHRLAEPGAGTDQHPRRAGHGAAGLQGEQVGGRERLEAVGGGLKVVDQPGPGQAEHFAQRGAVEPPGQVGDLRGLALGRLGHGTGDGEAGRGDAPCGLARVGEECLDEGCEVGIVPAAAVGLEDRPHRAALDGGQQEPGRGAADVARQDLHARTSPGSALAAASSRCHSTPARGARRCAG